MENTLSVIEWFKSINNKGNVLSLFLTSKAFIHLFLKSYLQDAINFAKSAYNISNEEIDIIMQARKTLLFYEKEIWIKKDGNEDFDVPMGCYDGAEVCELVGSFILTKLSSIVKKVEIGLYRDDGLGVLRNMSGPQQERIKKQICKYLKTVV